MALNKNDECVIDTYPSLGIRVEKYPDKSHKADRILDSKTGKIIHEFGDGVKIENIYLNGIIEICNTNGEHYNYSLIKLVNKNGMKSLKFLMNNWNFKEIHTNPYCPRLFVLVTKCHYNPCTFESWNTFIIADENGDFYTSDGMIEPQSFECDSYVTQKIICQRGDATLVHISNDAIFYCDNTTPEEDLLKPVITKDKDKDSDFSIIRYTAPVNLLEEQFAILNRDYFYHGIIGGMDTRRIDEYRHDASGLICRKGTILPCEYTEIIELEKGENDNYRIYYVEKKEKAGVIKAYKSGTYEYIVPLDEKWQSYKNKKNYPFMVCETKQADQKKYHYTYGAIKIEIDKNENHTARLIDGLENMDYPKVEVQKSTIKGAKCILFTTSTTQILVHENSCEKLEYTQIIVEDNFIKASNGDGYDVYFTGPKGFKLLAKKVNQVSWNSHPAFNEQVLTMTQTDDVGNVSTKVYRRRLVYPKKPDA